MKAFGKIIVLATSTALALMLAACGGNSSPSASAASSSAPSASAASASASSSAAASSASAAAQSAIEDADTYSNEFFGIEFDLPEGWSFVDVSTLQKMGDLATAAAEGRSLDMVASAADQSNAIMVSIEEPKSTNANMTAESFLEAQQTEMENDLEGNYSYTANSATITFNGMSRELPAVMTDVTVNGGHFFVCRAAAEQEGHFFSAIAIAATEEEVTDTFEHFKALSE